MADKAPLVNYAGVLGELLSADSLDLDLLKLRGQNMPAIYTSETAPVSPAEGDIWLPPSLFSRQWIKARADRTLTSSTATQALFANGTLTLEAGTYEFQALLYLTTMSATSGNAGFDLLGAGSSTLANILYLAYGIDNTTPLNAGTRTGSASITSASPASIVTATTGTGMVARIAGTFEAAAGTIIPSIKLVTANAAVLKAGSSFVCTRMGEQTAVSFGNWA